MSIDDSRENNRYLHRAARTIACPEPQRLSEWAAENFYLSAESSYVQGAWEAYPFQIGIMDLISNDDVRELWFLKSARLGYTKCILAAMGYFAEHKKRNQAVWQPVDDDADEFVKTELDPMIRDVPSVQAIFPHFNKKSKHNTLRQKAFTGSTIHIRGGKSAKNYRRISVDVAHLDELDAFDRDVDREGDPVTLAAKRVEGATFPKIIAGSTPKIKGESLTEDRFEQADCQLRYEVPCPHCDEYQVLEFGGRDVPHGMKWQGEDPETAAYLCRHCAALFTQNQYLDTWERGRWRDQERGIWLDGDAQFRDAGDNVVDVPASVGMHTWTIYSPQTTWQQIVREFLAARKDRGKLKTFTNTTLGETWVDEDVERLERDVLYRRREHYTAQVPQQVSAITFGVDTQDDRFEIQFDGWGEGEERWSLDYVRLFGDPSRPQIWERLAEVLQRQFIRDDGLIMTPLLGCQDHGGHFSDEVTRFSRKLGVRFLIPVKGSSVYGKPVALMPRKANRNRVYLTEVGTDTAKDLLYQRLQILEPGPGYWHFPIAEAFDEEYFAQLTAEDRVRKLAQGQWRYVWDAKGRRNESWDCSVYSLAAIRVAQQFMGLRLDAAAAPASAATSKQKRKSSKRAGDWLGTEGNWL